MHAPNLPTTAVTSIPIRVISHNIRYATTHPFKGEELWEVRCPRLVSELRHSTQHNPYAFIGLQEVLHRQLVDILAGLNGPSEAGVDAEWAYVGVGRDDGKEKGEYSPVLFRPAAWTLEHSETIWLSETPDRPSKGWDAGLPRILTLSTFHPTVLPSTRSPTGSRRSHGSAISPSPETPSSLPQICVLSTHFDDSGAQSRLHSARLIIETLTRHLPSLGYPYPSTPILLAGDFNSEPHESAYQTLNSADSPVRDLREVVELAERGRRVSGAKAYMYGHKDTYTSFAGESPVKRIDFLFVSKAGLDAAPGTGGYSWDVKGYAVLESRFDDGVYISDHRAVVGDLVLTV